MSSEDTLTGYLAAWLPWLAYLGLSVWLTFLVVWPLRSISQSLKEIASELKAIKPDRRQG